MSRVKRFAASAVVSGDPMRIAELDVLRQRGMRLISWSGVAFTALLALAMAVGLLTPSPMAVLISAAFNLL
ncbi:MAG: hypothetical protein DI568_17400, partial [Sphingomonas sp.]